jgi:hypothetical protein
LGLLRPELQITHIANTFSNMTKSAKAKKAAKAKSKEPPKLPDWESEDEEATHYRYRDFAHVELPQDDDVTTEEEEKDAAELKTALKKSALLAVNHQENMSVLTNPSQPFIKASVNVRSQRFPVKLYAILAQPELSDIISWMPHGRSWKVFKPQVFEAFVLPVFFDSDNYHSFNRVINAWSFRRMSDGPDRGSYFHEVSYYIVPRTCSLLLYYPFKTSTIHVYLCLCYYQYKTTYINQNTYKIPYFIFIYNRCFSGESHSFKNICVACPRRARNSS